MFVTRSDQYAIQPDIGAVADAVECEFGSLFILESREGELLDIPPWLLELSAVDLFIVHMDESVFIETVGGKRSHDCAWNIRYVSCSQFGVR